MPRAHRSASRRPQNKAAKTRTRGRKRNNKHRDNIQLSLLLLAISLCGFFIVRAYLLSIGITDSVYSSYLSSSLLLNDDTMTQSNDLFSHRPTFSQNFANKKSSGYLDPSIWSIIVGPAQNSNNEAQYYTDGISNLRIENGALRLIATHEAQAGGYQYSSARIETKDKKSFLYGRIDVTAKLPKGVGTWPAIWLLPANDKYADLSSPDDLMRYKNGGEIDIVEAVGFEPNVVYGVAHTLSDTTDHPDGTGSYNAVKVPGNDSEFKTYSLLWTPDNMTFLVDGQSFFTYSKKTGADYKTWPFDQPFYMIINLAIGGTWGGMDISHFPNGIDDQSLPASLDIQSIYYYPYIGSSTKK